MVKTRCSSANFYQAFPFRELSFRHWQCVFSPCLDNDYNTLGVLHSFQVAFLHKGGFFFFTQRPTSTMFSPKVFPFCRLHLVQLAIHFPKLLPQHIYIYVPAFTTMCCTIGCRVKICTPVLPKVLVVPKICTSAPYFLPQVSAFRPTQLRHSLRVKGRFSFKYVFVLRLTSR